MGKIKVKLKPIVSNINLPTVIKSTIPPGETNEYLFIATQVGEIYQVGKESITMILDISSQIIKLGANGGYDERGLLGLAFHPNFTNNGLFYLHYSVAGSQGPGTNYDNFIPNPCNMDTINLKWENREMEYDHVDTIEEWFYDRSGPRKIKTLLNLKRPFFNHNGVNSLNFSPETGKLVFVNGDGGSGYDPFNLAQNDNEIAGKIIEIDLTKVNYNNPPIVTRFSELPTNIKSALTLVVKGVRNSVGISYQKIRDKYVKYIGNVGQDLVESIYSFVNYNPIPVNEIGEGKAFKNIVNLGWRGWEGTLPTSVINQCENEQELTTQTIAYYNEAIALSTKRLIPLVSYFQFDSRANKFKATALTGVQYYKGDTIPDLKGAIIFSDLLKTNSSPATGALAYTAPRRKCKVNEFQVIETNYNDEPSFYTTLGTNMDNTRIYLGTYKTMIVTSYNQGTVYEIIS